MDPKFAGKPIPVPFLAGRTDLDQMPDTPTRIARHRRAQSETFFRLPDFDDDILLDDIVADFNLDISAPSLSPSADTHMQPANSADSSSNGPGLVAGPGGDHNPRPLNHFRSLSVDADFFDGLEFGEAGATTPAVSGEEKKMMGSGSGSRHRHSNSMDGSFSSASFEAESSVKKAMPPDRLAELALIDPKRAKRFELFIKFFPYFNCNVKVLGVEFISFFCLVMIFSFGIILGSNDLRGNVSSKILGVKVLFVELKEFYFRMILSSVIKQIWG